MPKNNNMGLIRLVLTAILVLLVLGIISEISKFLFGERIAWFVTVIVLILGVLWLLSKEGQKRIKQLLDDAGL